MLPFACEVFPSPGAAPAELNRLVELFDRAVTGPIAQAPQYASTRRAALHRAGRFEAAVEGRWAPPSPQDFRFQAMAHWRLGRRDEVQGTGRGEEADRAASGADVLGGAAGDGGPAPRGGGAGEAGRR
jgi:hypothetical protein